MHLGHLARAQRKVLDSQKSQVKSSWPVSEGSPDRRNIRADHSQSKRLQLFAVMAVAQSSAPISASATTIFRNTGVV